MGTPPLLYHSVWDSFGLPPPATTLGLPPSGWVYHSTCSCTRLGCLPVPVPGLLPAMEEFSLRYSPYVMIYLFWVLLGRRSFVLDSAACLLPAAHCITVGTLPWVHLHRHSVRLPFTTTCSTTISTIYTLGSYFCSVRLYHCYRPYYLEYYRYLSPYHLIL